MRQGWKHTGFVAMSLTIALSTAACVPELAKGSDTPAAEEQTTTKDEQAKPEAATSDGTPVDTKDTDAATVSGVDYEDQTDGGHALAVDGESASYKGISVTKTGEADGDEADFYGENAAVFATNGATLNLEDITVTSDGTHANGVFSYGEGTTVNISDSTIETTGNCSGGIMVTGGGMLNAEGLTVHTTGNSSAAIRSDRGGGTENVSGGTYTTEGTGSPAIYSTADVFVTDASLTSTASQGVVVEGKNSVTLKDTELIASNTTKNSDKSDWYQAVMIYQSMSGDAAQGEASFVMDGGSLTNKNGDVFFVNNTVATIDLSGATITNEDAAGLFLRAAAAGWGSEGSNGGHVTLNATNQAIKGVMAVDEVSSLNLYLKEGSTFTGSINTDATAGEVYVDIADGATWTLTSDAHITSLTCSAGAIELNGHTLYVGDTAYEEGTASTGEAIEVEVAASTGGPGEAPGGMPGDGQGEPPAKPDGDGEPPAKPDGQDGEPPAKPDGDSEPPAKPGETGATAEGEDTEASAALA